MLVIRVRQDSLLLIPFYRWEANDQNEEVNCPMYYRQKLAGLDKDSGLVTTDSHCSGPVWSSSYAVSGQETLCLLLQTLS